MAKWSEWLCCASVGLALSSPCLATEVALAGLLGSRAVVLVVDGGSPRTLALGQRSPEGVRLVAIEGDLAIVEFDGIRKSLRLGEQVVSRAVADSGAVMQIEADGRGHFLANGRVNGGAVRFLVDTGASLVSLGRSDARRLGIDLSRATVGRTQTASGVAKVWLVRLDSVQIGEWSINNVDAAVLENDMPLALLGMSVLNRMEMTREGSRLVLKKRY